MAPIAVLGGSGGVAQEAVRQLLAADREVRAVGRSKERLQKLFEPSDNLSIVEASVGLPESLKTALAGTSGVINAVSGKGYWSPAAVDFQGSGNVAEAAKEAGAEHVVLVSSALVTKKNRFNPIRVLLNNIRWGLMDNKLKGEELLRQSGVGYTVVRPGQLTNNEGGKEELKLAQGDKGSPGKVSRADVAAVCIAALDHREASNWKTIELSSVPGTPNLLEHIFDGTVADS